MKKKNNEKGVFSFPFFFIFRIRTKKKKDDGRRVASIFLYGHKTGSQAGAGSGMEAQTD